MVPLAATADDDSSLRWQDPVRCDCLPRRSDKTNNNISGITSPDATTDKPETVTDKSPAITMPWYQPLFQPLRFVFSGGLATLAHWLVMALLIVAGVQAAVATAVGAFIGAVSNYFLQRNVTFRSDVAHRRALRAYLLVVVITWIANLLIFIACHHGLGLTPLYAQGVTTALVACLSYVLYKTMVFHER